MISKRLAYIYFKNPSDKSKKKAFYQVFFIFYQYLYLLKQHLQAQINKIMWAFAHM